MISLKFWLQLSASGLLLVMEILNGQGAGASEAPVLRLRDRVQHAPTVREWIAQEAATAKVSAVQVSAVQLNLTTAGLEITLQTADGQVLNVDASKFRTEGNALIAEIPAVLALPTGEEFTAEKVAADIASVQVTQRNSSTIWVTVMGIAGVPKTTVSLRTGTAVYALKPIEDEALEEEIVITGERKQDSYRVPNSSTATKTDTPLRDIPQSIQVVTQEVLRDRGINKVGEALENVSSVTKRDATGSIFGDLFTIRGFLIQSGTVSNIFRDGVPYVIPGTLTTNDIDRVEVLKGPASVLFGAGQPGGVINLVSKQPLSNPYKKAEVSIGSFDNYRTAIDLSGPIDPEKKILYRVNADYETSGSFRNFVNTRCSSFPSEDIAHTME